MQAFQITFKPSCTGKSITVLLHIWAVFVCINAFYGFIQIIGLSLLAISFIWAWYIQSLKQNNAIHKISVNPKGHAFIFFSNNPTASAAVLCGGSLVSPYALFLKWQLDTQIVWQFVLPDMTTPQHYRRLLVWARWGQPKH